MQTPRILVVDDDMEDRAIILEALEEIQPGNAAACAENGEVALRLLNEYAVSGVFPNLVVLDLNMPRMNGTSTLRNLKKDARFKEISVVIYSTSVNPIEKEACMELGAQAYITKPLSYRESLETARYFLSLCEPAPLVG